MSYCKIQDWFKADKYYIASFEKLGQKLFLNLTTNDQGKAKIVKLLVNSDDLTSEINAHGGGNVPLIPIKDEKLAKDCENFNYYLAWRIGGETASYIKEEHKINEMLLYVNYNQDKKNYLYFSHKFSPVWLNSEIHQYDESLNLPNWVKQVDQGDNGHGEL